MPTSRMANPVGAWNASGRTTALNPTSVLIRNTGPDELFWVITDTDTLPTIAVADAHVIGPDETFGITLATGERLWRARRKGASQITVTIGAAV